MGKIKNWLKKSDIISKFRIILELYKEYKKISRHLGGIGLMNNKSKLEADITIRYHAIEKGLALSKPRLGFGEKKIEYLLKLLQYYKAKFNDPFFLNQALSILHAYFIFNEKNGHINLNLKDKFEKLLNASTNYNKNCLGGTLSIEKKKIDISTQFDFEKFINSRYSIRDFSNQPVDVNLIYKALEIAKKNSICV